MLQATLTVIIVSASWGLLIAFLANRIRWAGLRKALTRLSGFVLVAAAAVYLFLYVGSRPLPNDTIFRNRATYAVEIFARPADAQPARSIRLYFPHAVRWKDESAIDIYVDRAKPPNRRLRALLRTGSSFQVRTTQTCEGLPSHPDSVFACVDGTPAQDHISFRWLLRGAETGMSYATIQLPKELLAATLREPTWRGVVTRDGDPITLGSPQSRRSWYSQRYDSDTRIPKPKPLSQNRQQLAIDGVDYDFSTGEITLGVPVRETLGVSPNTHGWISLVLTIVAGALGSGWAWQLLPTKQTKRDRSLRSSKAA